MHCVDLGESFPTHIYLQSLASMQPRTSPVKFAGSLAVQQAANVRGAEVLWTCGAWRLPAEAPRLLMDGTSRDQGFIPRVSRFILDDPLPGAMRLSVLAEDPESHFEPGWPAESPSKNSERYALGPEDSPSAGVISYVFSNSELERIFSNELLIVFYFFENHFLKISKIFVAKSHGH